MAENEDIRVRIAPSPTGYLHLGTMRTALVNYVFAKKENGKFIIRMEDTDTSRSLPIYEEDILGGLKMIGIDWDEGPDVGGPFSPYRQSERGDIYEKQIKKLIDDKKAYWCFCNKEDLEEEKKAMLASGIFPRYSGKCRILSDSEVKSNIKEGKSAVIRLIVPSGINIEFNDIIRGKISTSSDTIDDFVIAKDLRSPLYNLAVVIDDYLMKISHVIRGEDHISNTPKQILIQRAFDFDEVKYAHLPLVLAPDRSKMSKRKMETSFVEYLKEGYLPEALLNFLILIGWHPEDDKEIMALEEIISKFNLKRVQKGGAIFDVEKLDWFNSQYIKNISLDELFKKIKDFVPKEWTNDKGKLKRALAVEKDRLSKLSEFKDLAEFFFERGELNTELLRWQGMSFNNVVTNLNNAKSEIEKIGEKDFIKLILEEKLMPLADALGRGEVLWPLRVALSGRKNSPGPFEIMEVLGKEESLKRIDQAITKTSLISQNEG